MHNIAQTVWTRQGELNVSENKSESAEREKV